MLGGIDRDREAESLTGQNGGVDADYVAVRVDERAAGVSGIERGVGLDDVVHQSPRLRAQRAAERADDARGYRVGEPVRIADRDDELARTQRGRIAKRGVREFRRVDAQHREIGVRIVADQRRGNSRPSSSATAIRSRLCTT